MGAWEIVDQYENMNAIQQTWAFKCKNYPDAQINQYKARLYAIGDQKLKGIYFFETYAPVFQQTTVRLMLNIEILLVFQSNQGGMAADFLHADIREGENAYVDMPKNSIRKHDVRSV